MRRPLERVAQERRDCRVLLEHRDRKPPGRQKQRVLPEPRRGVDGARVGDAAHAGRAHEQLSPQAVRAQPGQQAREIRPQHHAVAHEREPLGVTPQLDALIARHGRVIAHRVSLRQTVAPTERFALA